MLALLAVLGFQVGSGLFASDDIAFNGPLYPLLTKDTSDVLTGLHRQNMWMILALVALHVGAVLYYLRVKRENLVKPMLTGCKPVSDPTSQPARGGGLVALLVALGIAGSVVWISAGALLPPPPPAPAESAPGW